MIEKSVEINGSKNTLFGGRGFRKYSSFTSWFGVLLLKDGNM